MGFLFMKIYTAIFVQFYAEALLEAEAQALRDASRSRDEFIYEPWLVNSMRRCYWMCARAHVMMCMLSAAVVHSYICHDQISLCVLCRICILARSISHSYVCWDWSRTHSYVCHNSFMYVPWLIHICYVTHSLACTDPIVYVPWLIHRCTMTDSVVLRMNMR